MSGPCFPNRNSLVGADPNAGINLENFRAVVDDLDTRGRRLSKDYLASPVNVNEADVKSLIYDTYSTTVDIFDEKERQGGTLSSDEQAIYNQCKKVTAARLSDEGRVNSLWGLIFNAVERVRDCIDSVKEWFGLGSDEDKANQQLVTAGKEVLPLYGNVLVGIFYDVVGFFYPTFYPSIVEMGMAQIDCATFYQQTLSIDKPLASTMLDIADYAYKGYSTTSTTKFSKLTATEVPQAIRNLYDADKGLLNCTRGLRAWLGKKGNDIVVSFSGTDTSNFDMVYADIIQLSAPSTLYLKAAGLVNLIAAAFSGKTIYTTGHSLGGGLSQFSLTANVKKATLQGYAYNPAGLSRVSVDHLKEDRLLQAKGKVRVFMTCKDPVSSFGGKIGCLVTLPKTTKNGHFMDDLKECMKSYQTATYAASETITLSLRNHSESDFIPYTRKLSIRDSGGTNYPVFNSNYGSYSPTQFESAILPKPLFQKFQLSQSTSESCMGVYNKFNGTAHTVMNRLLLITTGGPTITTKSTGNLHSSIIYGKFGLGVKQFVETLKTAYVDSNELFAGSRTAYEKVLARLGDPFEFDKAAWIDGIRIQFGIDMNAMFSRYPLAEKEFDAFLVKFTSDRMDLYQSMAVTGRAPTADEKKRFMSGLSNLAATSTTGFMQEAVNAGAITRSQMTSFQSQIADFCKRILDTF